MSIKDLIIQSLLKEKIYTIKKEMRKEIANTFKDKLCEKDEIISSKNDLIALLIKENQQLKLKLDIHEDSKKASIAASAYPSNMID